MNAFLCRAHRPAYPLGSSLILAAVLLGAPAAKAQIPQIAQDLDAVHTAEQQHRPAADVGAMWAHLASEYHGSADFLKAEDAYNRSLHLLKDVPNSRPLYATTLDNLASLYLIYGRVDEAEGIRKQALAIRKKLGNPADVGASEVHVADIAIARRQYKKAEQFALLGLKDMSSSPPPPTLGMLSALITVTYARCLRGHPGEALSSAQQAFDFANAHFEQDSPAIGFSLQTLGYAQWKSGEADEGGKTMQRALVILRSRLVPSDPRLAGALTQYEDYLLTTKRRPEADEIRDEVARMNTRPGAACATCTVSVYSLAKGLR
jgi:tetratricopeptide (TPR) repeat protein